MICSLLVAVRTLSGLAPASARAQVVAPSVYTTAIQVQGEAAGTEFADWAASGIPVVDMDPADNPAARRLIDIANVQIANDDDYIYIHATMHAGPTSLANLFLAFDTDQNLATGFDVFGLGVDRLGARLSNRFPVRPGDRRVQHRRHASPAALGNGGALIYPFWTGPAPQGTEIEWASSPAT